MQQQELKEKKIGYFYSITSAFIYALQVVVAKTILGEGIPPLDLLLIQYTTCTIILGLFLMTRRDRSLFYLKRENWKNIIIQGIVGCALTSLLLYLAMQQINAGIASMLLYLCPVYVCIFFVLTGIRKIGLANKISVITAAVGAVLVLNLFGQEDMQLSVLGITLAALSGITYAFYGLFADLKLRKLPAEQMLFYMYFVATILFWVLNPDILVHPPQVENAAVWGRIVFLALLQVMPMALLNLGIRAIGSNRATIIATAELPFTLILAFFFLHETMSGIQILGILMIIASILILQIKK